MKILDQYENVSCIIDIYWDIIDKSYIARNANNPEEIIFKIDSNNLDIFSFKSNISLDNFVYETIIELKDLTENDFKKVNIRYTYFYLEGEKKAAFQYINHVTKFLYVELKQKIMLPIKDEIYGVVDEIHIDDFILDNIVDYTITNTDVIIINEDEFLRRINNHSYNKTQDNKINTKPQKILWFYDDNKFSVYDAVISFINNGKYRDNYCIKLKNNTCMYVKRKLLNELLRAEEFIDNNLAVNTKKMIMEFQYPDEKFILSNVEISVDPFKILGSDYYRVKYHSGLYEFLSINELENRLLKTYKSKTSIEIIFWNNKTYKLNVNDKIVLVWTFYTSNLPAEHNYTYSEYEILNIIISESSINKNFIEFYNLNTNNTFGLDVESVSKRLYSINGVELPDNVQSEEFSMNNLSKERIG